MNFTATALAAAAIATLGLSAVPAVAADADKMEFKCEGINSCKGTSACKTAEHACKGQNACKGHGWLPTKDAKECTAKGGHELKM
jgi:uncharacterized membrane protein